MAAHRALVLGLGNLLMGDEGVGVHAIRALRSETWPSGVALVDGGSGTFHLLRRLGEFDRLIVIEGVEDGAAPGTVSVLSPLDPDHLPRVLARHDAGLRDLIESAALLGPLPHIELVSISIGASVSIELGLSAPVAAALPQVRECVRELLATRGAES